MRIFLLLGIFALSLALLPCPSVSEPRIGEAAPEFTALTYEGEEVSLAQFADRVVVLEWFNRGCPFVVKHYEGAAMQEMQKEYAGKGVVWLTVNSTNPKHRDFLTSKQAEQVKKSWKISDAKMIFDKDGRLGQLYAAKTTPHVFVIAKGKLVYEGAVDDAPDTDSDPRKSENYLRQALDAALAGGVPSSVQTKPYGCSIKYAD